MKKPFKIIELYLNPEKGMDGVYAVSIVNEPAMESEFMLFSKELDVKFKSIDKEQKLVMGALLIPNKMILRKFEDEMAYVYFSPETVRQSSQLYLQNGHQNDGTIEHMVEVEGLSVVESWIIDDPIHDKTRLYGMDYPVGTWMATMKITDDEIWNEVVKTGMVKGFSIEGSYQKGKEDFSKTELSDEEILEKIIDLVKNTDENITE